MSHAASTVNALQSDSKAHTHTHILVGASTQPIHTPKVVFNPPKLQITKNRTASCSPPALRCKSDRKTEGTRTRTHKHTHTHARDAKSKALLLIHASAQNACRCQNALLGRFFFSFAWQWSHECALIHVARREGVFLEMSFQPRPKKKPLLFWTDLKKGADLWSSRGRGKRWPAFEFGFGYLQ